MPTRDPIVVGVGASAGGLEAFAKLLGALPANSGMAFALGQHLTSKDKSSRPQILANATPMSVSEVRDGMRPEAKHVYVISAKADLSLADSRFHIESRNDDGGYPAPVDHFFRSLANTYGARAIGVVLSGTASDGTAGLCAIKAKGGATFAQQPASAKFDGMPRGAIAAGSVDYVLTPERIAKELARRILGQPENKRVQNSEHGQQKRRDPENHRESKSAKDLQSRNEKLITRNERLQAAPITATQEMKEALHSLDAKIARLAGDIHGTSRRLHPAILDDLGLEAALREECRGFFSRYRVPVEFEPKKVPAAVPPEVSLCLYRVARKACAMLASMPRPHMSACVYPLPGKPSRCRLRTKATASIWSGNFTKAASVSSAWKSGFG